MAKNRLTKRQREDIAKKYKTGKYSCAELGRLYGVSGVNVRNILRYRKIKINQIQGACNRKHTFNENYFEKIDTEAKAYFLGLLYADGCNHADTNSFSIGLQKKDRHILKEFNKEINSKRPFSITYLSKKNPSHQDSYRLNFQSKKICEDLIRLGCVPKKSLILKFPTEEQVPGYLLHHFVRGYLDGDGCISQKRYNRKSGRSQRLAICIISTSMFLYELLKIVQQKLNIKCRIENSHDNGITKDFRISSFKSAIPFLDWLYKDANFYLKRKYKKYLKIKSFKSLVYSRKRDSKGHYIKRKYPPQKSGHLKVNLCES